MLSPKPATHTSKVAPAWRLGGRRVAIHAEDGARMQSRLGERIEQATQVGLLLARPREPRHAQAFRLR